MSDGAPLLGDISLTSVQRIEHVLDGGLSRVRVAGLAGEVMQRSGRPSHAIRIQGVVYGPEAGDAIGKLQTAAAGGDELTFAADITTALEIQKVVISSFRAASVAGTPDRYDYEIVLLESPPLPPPAEVEGFGGLDDFGSDLGFDTSILGDLENAASLASKVAGAAMDVVGKLGVLSGLDGLGLDGLLEPMQGEVGKVGEIGKSLGAAVKALTEAFE